MKNNVPPTGYIEGIDLVTEGTLTIERTLQYLREGRKKVSLMYQPDGASRLCSALLEADDIEILMGTARTPPTRALDLPETLQLKSRMVEDLSPHTHGTRENRLGNQVLKHTENSREISGCSQQLLHPGLLYVRLDIRCHAASLGYA